MTKSRSRKSRSPRRSKRLATKSVRRRVRGGMGLDYKPPCTGSQCPAYTAKLPTMREIMYPTQQEKDSYVPISSEKQQRIDAIMKEAEAKIMRLLNK